MNHSRPSLALVLAMALLALAGCSDGPTGISAATIAQHRAAWLSHGLNRYGFDYQFTGFLINGVGDHFHVVVIGDTARSVTDINTGLLAIPGDFPSINHLFDEAEAARRNGGLTAIEFDPVLAFPTRITLAGPPDASGSRYATNITPLP